MADEIKINVNNNNSLRSTSKEFAHKYHTYVRLNKLKYSSKTVKYKTWKDLNSLAKVSLFRVAIASLEYLHTVLEIFLNIGRLFTANK